MNKSIQIFFFVLINSTLFTYSIAQNQMRPSILTPNGFKVNSYTGSLYYERTDVRIPGRLSIDITFSYNSSRSTKDWGMGQGWTFTYNMAYSLDSLGIYIERKDGRRDFFKKSGSKHIAPLQVFDSLSEYQPNKFVLIEKGGTKYFFDNSTHKKITKLQNRDGTTISLTYTDTLLTMLNDASGRTCTFTWANGHLKEVIDQAGTPELKTTYEYDLAGNLAKVTNPSLFAKQYFYDRNNRITGMKDERGYIMSITYNINSAVQKIVSCISTQTFSYIQSQRKTLVSEVVSGQNQVTSYQFDALGRIIHKQGNCCGLNVTYKYDDKDNIVSIQKGNQETKYEFDSHGNIIKEIDGLGNTSSYTYDADFDLVTSIKDKRGYTTTFEYENSNLKKVKRPLNVIQEFVFDQRGDLILYIDGNGSSSSFKYNNNGYLTEVTNADKGVVNFEYDTRGNVLMISDARKFTTTYHYNDLGTVKKISDALNNETLLSYDEANNLTMITNAKGKKTTFGYDGLNRPISLETPLGIITQAQYDEKGNLVKIIDGKGNITAYTFNFRKQVLSESDAIGNTQSYEYDDAGNRTRFINKNGNITNYEYDVLSQLTRVTDAVGGSNAYGYDANGNMISSTDANGNTTTYKYDELNRLKNVVNALFKDISFDYDNIGNILNIKDRNGNTTTFAYDSLNRKKRRTDALGGTETYTYDKNSNLLSIENALKFVSKGRYDAMNRLIAEINEVGDSVIYHYDELGNMNKVVESNGNINSLLYDEDNRPIEIADNIGTFIRFSYDKSDNIITESNTLGHSTTYYYDVLDRLINVSFPDNTTQHFGYDKNGNGIEEINQKGLRTFYEFDRSDRLSKITDPMGNIARFTYDLNGNKTSLVDAKGNITSYNYDALNRLKLQVFADGSTSSFTYDHNNNILSRTDNNGVLTHYVYDKLNRLKERIYPNNQIDSYSFDSIGRMKTAVNSNASISMNYDPSNRLLSENLNGRVVNYEYNTTNRTKKITYPSGLQLVYKKDLRNRLTEIEEGNSLLVAFSYDGDNNVKTKQYSNNTSTNYFYDKANNVTNIQVNPNNLMQTNFSYDSVYNRRLTERIHRPNFSEQYTYDNFSQLKTFTLGAYGNGHITATKEHHYNYDPLGNRVNTLEDTLSRTYSPNNLNQYTRIISNGSAFQPTYDKNGNILTDGQNTYTYDYSNRLTQVQNSGITVLYKYDALGRRISNFKDDNEVVFSFDGANTIEEKKGAISKSYVFGDKEDEILLQKNGTFSYFYNTDQSNSVQSITNNLGNIVESYNYDPFGFPHIYSANDVELNSSQLNTLLFNGRSYEFGSNTYNFRNRELNPYLGRFLNRDPIGFLDGVNLYTENISDLKNNLFFLGRESIQNVGTYDYANRMYSQSAGLFLPKDQLGPFAGDINLYRYVVNNPINKIDPYGLYDWPWRVRDDWFERLSNMAAGAADNLSALPSAAIALSPANLARLALPGYTTDDLISDIRTPLTRRIRQRLGYDEYVDPCSESYKSGEWIGIVISSGTGVSHLGKNLLAQMGKQGSLFTRLGRGASRLVYDNRRWPSVARSFRQNMNRLDDLGRSLHHWAIPQRARSIWQGIRNAGFNYFELSAGFNSWMNGSTFTRNAVEWALRGWIITIETSPIFSKLTPDECDCP